MGSTQRGCCGILTGRWVSISQFYPSPSGFARTRGGDSVRLTREQV